MTVPSNSYLDTTVFADQLFGTAAEKKRIDKILSERPARASSFVREQFQATFLRAAVLVYNQLFETKDAIETIRRTDEFPFFTQGEGRKARKVLLALLGHGEIETSDVLATLERLVEVDMLRGFDRMAHLTDETGCCRCHGRPSRDENGVYRFQENCSVKQPRPCRIERFWSARRGDLQRLAEIPESAPRNKSIENARTAAEEVLAGDPPRGLRCSVHLSDPVIVAESDRDSILVTSNVKDFEPLAQAFEGTRSVVTYR